MKIYRGITQGTTAWSALRMGIPTASAFASIMTPTLDKNGNGVKSKTQDKYMMQLLAERCMGHPSDEFVSLYMQRGKEDEVKARNYYRFQRDCAVEQITFVTNDMGTIGCSPDGFVGDPGTVEFKRLTDAKHMGFLLGYGSAYEEYKVQCNGILWITERQWVDTVSWHPELPWSLVRAERDEVFIAALSVCVKDFSRRLEDKFRELLDRGWAKENWREAAPSGEFVPPTIEELRVFNELHGKVGMSN